MDNILKINLQDIDEVMCLIKEVIAEMENNEISQWDEVYPDYKGILGDIHAETMFGVFKNLELAGIVVLDKNQSPEYSSVNWELNNGSPLVMHRLCVHPKFQRQGVAKQLLKFSEQFAISSRCKSIRLDAFSGNPSALNLYANNGYLKRGMVTFRKGDFHCYEKIL
ncbi:GNAT family N-acetyltransferase [Pedobacter foliorum]|uniref:GNAT family N-acetyltransferase n=1 Tax=Pedobacter foliorum TaxID=2739058 RepID=UPI0015663BCE|nr:GNAT family N-acetyltransferase [Pedobacter foliorum]NRF39509.1 GNAT family N-acetyltransferase [Pedobacter foliorum]